MAELGGSARDITGGSPKKSCQRNALMAVDMGIDNQNSVQSDRPRFLPIGGTTNLSKLLGRDVVIAAPMPQSTDDPVH